MNTKQKGLVLEKYVCEQIISKGLDDRARPSYNSGATNSEKADIWTSLMILGQNAGIECKNQKNLAIPDWWSQTRKLQSLGREPILVYKLHNQPLSETLCTVYLDTLLDLLAELKNCKSKPHPKLPSNFGKLKGE